jgi:Sugar phosphate permease
MGKSRYLLLGFVIMCFNSLYQYSWNLLEPLFRTGFSASLVQVELGFTLFTISSTLTQPLGGYVADREGPKRVGIIASMLSALGFLGTSFSNDLSQFYVAWTLGSVGEGILYSIAANLAVKWFRERRGLATGMVTLGFGLGATLANPFWRRLAPLERPRYP